MSALVRGENSGLDTDPLKDVDLPGQRAIVTRLSRHGSHTIVSVQCNKRKSNEIPKAICCRPGGAHRARPVPAGNGTEHYLIQHHDDDKESTSRSDGEHHHHDYAGSGISAASPDHADYRYHYEVQAQQSKADRHDNHHYRAAGSADEGKRHDDHHNHAAAREGAKRDHIDDDHNLTPAAIIAGNRS